MGKGMLSHCQIWAAIDTIAARHGLTTSGLARLSGMNASTFNASTRVAPDGRLRWPSTESLAKVLEATGTSLAEFFAVVSTSDGARPNLPFGTMDRLSDQHFDATGIPNAELWDEINAPEVATHDAFALEVRNDELLPLFKPGDILVCSASAPIRRGDRVVVCTLSDQIIVRELKRRTVNRVRMRSIDGALPDQDVGLQDVRWIARVLWIGRQRACRAFWTGNAP